MAAKPRTVSIRQMARRAQAWHSLAAMHLAQGRSARPLFELAQANDAARRNEGQQYDGRVPIDCLHVPNVMD